MDGWQSFGVDLESGQPGLWRALAAVLHLGNVRVAAKEAASGTVAVLDAATLEQVGASSIIVEKSVSAWPSQSSALLTSTLLSPPRKLTAWVGDCSRALCAPGCSQPPPPSQVSALLGVSVERLTDLLCKRKVGKGEAAAACSMEESSS